MSKKKTKARHDEALKQAAVARLKSETLIAVARDIGVSTLTLRRWRNKYPLAKSAVAKSRGNRKGRPRANGASAPLPVATVTGFAEFAENVVARAPHERRMYEYIEDALCTLRAASEKGFKDPFLSRLALLSLEAWSRNVESAVVS